MTAWNGPGADMLIYNIQTTCPDLTIMSTGCGKVQYIPERGAGQRQRRMISLGIQDKEERTIGSNHHNGGSKMSAIFR